MSVSVALVAIFAVVLAVGGVFKLRDPEPTARMLAAFGLPASTGMARAVGLVELVAATAAVVLGGRVAGGALLLCFGVFAVLMGRLLQLGDAAASCGCFGRLSARPSPLHLAVDLAGASVGVLALITAPASFFDVRGTLDAGGLLEAGYILLAAWLVVVIMTVLADTMDATRRGPATVPVRTFSVPTSPERTRPSGEHRTW
jgi:hypothetical protein